MIYLINTDTCWGIASPIDEIKNYEKIYKIKKRSFENPLAIMVEDFKWFEQNTDLNLEQINFLKSYEKPFTILTESTPIKHWLNYEDENHECFRNKDIYEKVAFRVAHTKQQKNLIKKLGPIFLTSANLSGNPEIYEQQAVKNEFKYYIENSVVEIISDPTKKTPEDQSPSDIFEFVGNGVKVRYLRKS